MSEKKDLIRGTVVRIARDVPMAQGEPWAWVLPAGEYEVIDLFDRKSYDRPGHVGVVAHGPNRTLGLAAAGVALEDIEVLP